MCSFICLASPFTSAGQSVNQDLFRGQGRGQPYAATEIKEEAGKKN